jgi:enoyl-CoA hydratase/carnithine racemase
VNAHDDDSPGRGPAGGGGGDGPSLVRSRQGAVLVIRLNRPAARNALTRELLAALGGALVAAEDDPGIRAAVLTGTGDRAFCSGMDLRSFAGGGGTALDDTPATAAYQRLLAGTVGVPLVGAANGTALAGGLELLLGCDVVVASSAAEFGFPEVQRGLFPGGNGTALATRVGLGVALEMTLTGERVAAARAYEVGLVNRVVPPGEVLPAALAVAERIAANGPLGVAAARELVRLSVTDAAGAAERLAAWQRVVFTSEDAREGALAFVEKRAPVWRGR